MQEALKMDGWGSLNTLLSYLRLLTRRARTYQWLCPIYIIYPTADTNNMEALWGEQCVKTVLRSHRNEIYNGDVINILALSIIQFRAESFEKSQYGLSH